MRELVETIAGIPALRVAFGMFGIAACVGAVEWLRTFVARNQAPHARGASLLCRRGFHRWRYRRPKRLAQPGDVRTCRSCDVREGRYREYFGDRWGEF